MSTAKSPGIPDRYLASYGTAEERQAELKAARARRAARRNQKGSVTPHDEDDGT